MENNVKNLFLNIDQIENPISKELSDSLFNEIRTYSQFVDLNLTNQEITENIISLKKIIDKNMECNTFLDTCSNPNQMHLTIFRVNGKLYFGYEKCKKMIEFYEKYKYRYNYLYNSYKDQPISDAFIKNGSSQKFDKSRAKILIEFRKNVELEKLNGLYIYGKCGVGKTYLSFCLINHYSKKMNKSICAIYLQDYINKLRRSFTDKEYIYEVDKIRNDLLKCDVLLIDDIGSEQYTDWFYQNELLLILNERLNSKKITFFNSNYSMNDLKKSFLSKSKIPDKEIVIDRIIDRIKGLTNNKEFELIGKNLRYENEG